MTKATLPGEPAKPGFLALIKCPMWETYHFTEVLVVDSFGWVTRSRSHFGELFTTNGAVLVSPPSKVDVKAAIQAFPDPFFTADEAETAVKAWNERNKK